MFFINNCRCGNATRVFFKISLKFLAVSTLYFDLIIKTLIKKTKHTHAGLFDDFHAF